jgi:hypothetical protein
MARIGSVAAAPFVGGEFVSLYLGSTRVPTVPGPPQILSATYTTGIDFVETSVLHTVPNNGGSSITEYKYYFDGVEASFSNVNENGAAGQDFFSKFDLSFLGQAVQVSAVNGVGEGPKSAPVTVTEL